MFLKKFFLLLISLFCAGLSAQELLPFVQNYTKSDYTGDNQVWNVTQGADKAMYFANGHYLLRYNGVQWEKYSLPNKTIIRSVFAEGDRIYSGSYREFGYWQRINGIMHYTSLSVGKGFFSGEADNDEIWKIFRKGDKLYFQSFNAVYILNNKKAIERVKFPSQVSYCYVINDIIYAATVKNGVYAMEGTSFRKVENWDVAEDNVIHGLLKNKGQIYLFTNTNGIYKGDEKGLTYWDTPCNNRLKSEMIHNALFVNDSVLVVGTARQGLYTVNVNTGVYKNISRQNRLNNNAVLSLTLDSEKDLWLGLDNGISHIEISSPVSIFSDNAGTLGSVYSMAILPNGYLFASNHGVFRYDDKLLKAVEGSSGQAWEIYDDGADNYIIGHNDGTFLYNGKVLQKSNTVSGGWRIMKSNLDNCLFETTYSGIVAYKNSSDLSNYIRLDVSTRPYKNIVQVKPGELWAADNNKGLYRILYTDDLKVSSLTNITEKNKIDNDFGVRLFRFRNEIFFLINNRWYTYNSISETLENSDIFNTNFSNVSDIIPVDDNNFIVMKENLLYLINRTGSEFIWRLLPEKYYMGKLITEDTRVFKQNDVLYINLDDGFFTFNINQVKKKPSGTTIEAYYDNHLIDESTVIKYNRSIVINIISEYLGYNRPDLFYTLNDSQDFIPVKNGSLVLNNLGSGTQNIEIYSREGHDFVKINSYSFTVERPWYYSPWMIGVYVIIVFVILFFYYRWNKLRYIQKIKLNEEELKHKRQIMKLEMEAEMKLQQQEYEKHRLEMEVQSKASEVAGKSLSIAKHSEMIENIQEVLNSDVKNDQLKTKIKKIIKTSSISKNEWQSFEKNLMKSHEEFVERLTAKYPELTSKDIKLCIYLRMNLSSKEIAPLMNISFRGVELHRYRLRKKLDITTEDNLSKFMFNI
ncbi:helix-turn-helix and ligand-binding sensor domain-containing protein [Flavobacterium rhizosphaerae]|uniref:Histidine kinase n=1 Tax=Flavobacterium rhizosphaerae TaxID=3163298 RepID=A0ABW8YXT2_9FLAO